MCRKPRTLEERLLATPIIVVDDASYHSPKIHKHYCVNNHEKTTCDLKCDTKCKKD